MKQRLAEVGDELLALVLAHLTDVEHRTGAGLHHRPRHQLAAGGQQRDVTMQTAKDRNITARTFTVSSEP